MRLLLGIVFLVSSLLIAQDPTNILVYQDVQLGYGSAVNTAISNLWPSATVSAHNGNAATFNAALNSLGANWDIVILECWYNATNEIYWMGVNDLYDTSAIKLFASNWQWSGSAGQMTLANNMGVTSVSNISAPVIPHYAWETAHPICAGISNWGWSDPGLGILNARFTVSDATPITGWTSSAQAGQAGICVAND